MSTTRIHDIFRICAGAAALMIATAGAVAQDKQQKNVRLWKDPGNIAARDLFWGSASADRAPKGPFTFVEQDTSGTQPKADVKDATGQVWDVKFGLEAPAEVAASRLVWALGYFVEELYFVPSGTITGAKPGALSDHISHDGTFKSARFHLRDKTAKKVEEKWTLRENPFLNSKELSGFAILMTMINNWDLPGSRNTRIIQVGDEYHYLASDLGASFGKMGGNPLVPRTKWNLPDFQKEEFIEKVEDGQIDLDFEGSGGINKVPVEHARWFYGLVSQLTEEQLRAAFRAAGGNDTEVAGFSARLREKINELQKAVAPQ